MFYRILAGLIAVALIYVTYEIIATNRTYNAIYSPPAFMAMNADTGTIPIVQFLDFHCDVCKDNALVMMDYAEKNPDILYILRPVYNGGIERYDEVRTALATGLQDRYWQTMRTIAQYEGALTEEFYLENAALMDLDIERLKADVMTENAAKITEQNARAANKADFKSAQSLMVGGKLFYLQKPLTEDDLSRIVETAR